MKHLLHLVILSFVSTLIASACPPDWDKWLREREEIFVVAMELSPEKRIPELGLLVRASAVDPGVWIERRTNMSDPKYYKNKLYFLNKVQVEMLAIPGHARYYANRIHEANVAYWNVNSPRHSGSANWLGSEIGYGFDTLRNLPSAETVQVLGEMLSDEREREQSDTSPVPQAVAKFAVTSMSLLHIRDAPSAPIHQYSAKEVMAAWQAWYGEVKSGQRSFSFKGQAVEYRFSPDGTWETIPIVNPPDDAVRLPEMKEVGKATQPPQAEPEKKSFLWVWVGIVSAVGGVVMWVITRRRKQALRSRR
jgi:hypothetical protein